MSSEIYRLKAEENTDAVEALTRSVKELVTTLTKVEQAEKRRDTYQMSPVGYPNGGYGPPPGYGPPAAATAMPPRYRMAAEGLPPPAEKRAASRGARLPTSTYGFAGEAPGTFGVLPDGVAPRADAPDPLGGLSRGGPPKISEDALKGLLGPKGATAAGAPAAGAGAEKAAGAMGKLSGAMTIVAAVAGIATVGMSKLAETINTLSSSARTDAQKNEEIARSIPLIGRVAGAFIDLRDAANDIPDKIRRSKIAMEEGLLWQQGKQAQAMALDASRSAVGAYRARAGAFGGIAVGQAPLGDRSTYVGELRFQEESQRYPAQEAKKRAEAEALAGRDAVRGEQQRLNELVAKRGMLGRHVEATRGAERAAMGRESGATGSRQKAERQEAGAAAQLALNNFLLNEQRIVEQNNRLKAAGVTAAEKESAVRKANIAVMQAELSILQQKEQRLTGEAAALGQMNRVERMLAADAALAIKQGGLESVTPEQRELARRVAPGFVRKEEEKLGLSTAEGRRLREAGIHDGGNLDLVRQEIQKVQTQVQIAISLDEQALATKIAEALERAVGVLVKSIRAEFNAKLERMRSGRQMNQNLGGG